MSDELELMAIRINGVKEAIGMVDYHFGHLTNRTLAAEALAVRRLKSLNAWKAKAKEFRHQFFIEECAHNELLDELAKESGDDD